VASYSLRKFSRPDAIKMIRQMGSNFVNIKDFHLPLKSPREQLIAWAQEFRDAGLTITGGGTITMRSTEDAELRSYFEYAKACGMPLLVIAPTRDNLPQIEKLIKEYNIKAAIHNHGVSDRNFGTPLIALKALEGMDPRFGVCIDVGYTVECGLDLVETVRQAGSRLLDMHVWDMRRTGPKAEQCPVGDGILPVPAMFAQLLKMNYAGMVNLEYEIEPENPMPGMVKSIAYMRGVLHGLTA
jgi:sugar phosphate isomerase/epimerase